MAPRVAHQHGAFDDVFQFAHIAGPVIAGQHVDGRRRNSPDVLRVFLGILLQKVIAKQQQIGLSLAQRRNEDREDIQSIVEILAERSLGDGCLKILIGCRDQTHIGVQRFGAADAFELAFLNDAQQFHLRRQH